AVMTAAAPDGSRRVSGAVLRTGDGNSVTVLLGPDGRPSRVISGGAIALLDNYGEETVDVAVIAPNGQTQIIQGAKIPDGLLSRLDAAQRAITASTHANAWGRASAGPSAFIS